MPEATPDARALSEECRCVNKELMGDMKGLEESRRESMSSKSSMADAKDTMVGITNLTRGMVDFLNKEKGSNTKKLTFMSCQIPLIPISRRQVFKDHKSSVKESKTFVRCSTISAKRRCRNSRTVANDLEVLDEGQFLKSKALGTPTKECVGNFESCELSGIIQDKRRPSVKCNDGKSCAKADISKDSSSGTKTCVSCCSRTCRHYSTSIPQMSLADAKSGASITKTCAADNKGAMDYRRKRLGGIKESTTCTNVSIQKRVTFPYGDSKSLDAAPVLPLRLRVKNWVSECALGDVKELVATAKGSVATVKSFLAVMRESVADVIETVKESITSTNLKIPTRVSPCMKKAPKNCLVGTAKESKQLCTPSNNIKIPIRICPNVIAASKESTSYIESSEQDYEVNIPLIRKSRNMESIIHYKSSMRRDPSQSDSRCTNMDSRMENFEEQDRTPSGLCPVKSWMSHGKTSVQRNKNPCSRSNSRVMNSDIRTCSRELILPCPSIFKRRKTSSETPCKNAMRHVPSSSESNSCINPSLVQPIFTPRGVPCPPNCRYRSLDSTTARKSSLRRDLSFSASNGPALELSTASHIELITENDMVPYSAASRTRTVDFIEPNKISIRNDFLSSPSDSPQLSTTSQDEVVIESNLFPYQANSGSRTMDGITPERSYMRRDLSSSDYDDRIKNLAPRNETIWKNDMIQYPPDSILSTMNSMVTHKGSMRSDFSSLPSNTRMCPAAPDKTLLEDRMILYPSGGRMGTVHPMAPHKNSLLRNLISSGYKNRKRYVSSCGETLAEDNMTYPRGRKRTVLRDSSSSDNENHTRNIPSRDKTLIEDLCQPAGTCRNLDSISPRRTVGSIASHKGSIRTDVSLSASNSRMTNVTSRDETVLETDAIPYQASASSSIIITPNKSSMKNIYDASLRDPVPCPPNCRSRIQDSRAPRSNPVKRQVSDCMKDSVAPNRRCEGSIHQTSPDKEFTPIPCPPKCRSVNKGATQLKSPAPCEMIPLYSKNQKKKCTSRDPTFTYDPVPCPPNCRRPEMQATASHTSIRRVVSFVGTNVPTKKSSSRVSTFIPGVVLRPSSTLGSTLVDSDKQHKKFSSRTAYSVIRPKGLMLQEVTYLHPNISKKNLKSRDAPFTPDVVECPPNCRSRTKPPSASRNVSSCRDSDTAEKHSASRRDVGTYVSFVKKRKTDSVPRSKNSTRRTRTSSRTDLKLPIKSSTSQGSSIKVCPPECSQRVTDTKNSAKISSRYTAVYHALDSEFYPKDLTRHSKHAVRHDRNHSGSKNETNIPSSEKKDSSYRSNLCNFQCYHASIENSGPRRDDFVACTKSGMRSEKNTGELFAKGSKLESNDSLSCTKCEGSKESTRRNNNTTESELHNLGLDKSVCDMSDIQRSDQILSTKAHDENVKSFPGNVTILEADDENYLKIDKYLSSYPIAWNFLSCHQLSYPYNHYLISGLAPFLRNENESGSRIPLKNSSSFTDGLTNNTRSKCSPLLGCKGSIQATKSRAFLLFRSKSSQINFRPKDSESGSKKSLVDIRNSKLDLMSKRAHGETLAVRSSTAMTHVSLSSTKCSTAASKQSTSDAKGILSLGSGSASCGRLSLCAKAMLSPVSEDSVGEVKSFVAREFGRVKEPFEQRERSGSVSRSS